MSQGKLVDIFVPGADGVPQAATVPASQLDAAIAAGARLPTAKEVESAANEAELGGLGGQIATGIIGAGRTATMGLSDKAIEAGAHIIGDNSLRKQTLGALGAARETNSVSNMLGEAGGLFLGGGGMTAIGEAAEGLAAEKLGEGLAGQIGSMAVRGGTEGAMMGWQQQLTEDTLGDHALNGQALFASAAKDGLLGAGAGAVLGAGAYYLGGHPATGVLTSRSGPLSDAVADEIAGMPGTGRTVLGDARRAENLIEASRAAGSTAEQGAQLAGEIGGAARAAHEGGGTVSGLYDQAVGAYRDAVAGGNAELKQTITAAYEDGQRLLRKAEEGLDTRARKLADLGTKSMRQAEDVVNEAVFTQRPQQMAKLVDATKIDLQRDATAALLQDVGKSLDFVATLPLEGGSAGATRRVRAMLEDTVASLAKKDISSALMSEELMLKTNALKQEVGRHVPWNRFGPGGVETNVARYGITDGQNELANIYQKLRVGLEDEAVWGQAGAAQRANNESFTAAKGRRDDFGRRFTVSIDRESGAFVPEIDAGKMKGMLGQLGGAESDQAVKTVEAYIDGLRARITAAETEGAMSAAQKASTAEGKATLAEFEAEFKAAREDADKLGRIKSQLSDESSKGVGGLFGIVTDAVTKPATTMQRLAEVRNTVKKVEDGIEKSLAKLTGGKSEGIAKSVTSRAKDDVAKEIGEVRKLAGNPEMLETRLQQMVGNLASTAPQIAEEIKNAARRAIYWLAKEAPPATVRLGLLGLHDVKPRYSDTDISAWESKRKAALGAVDGRSAPKAIVDDALDGRINRDAIKTMEFVSPQLFAHVQSLAQEQLNRMALRGDLDSMDYQRKAAIAAVLKITPDGTYQPAFMSLMQSIKMPPPPPAPAPGAPGPKGTFSGRRMEIDPKLFATAGDTIEQGGGV